MEVIGIILFGICLVFVVFVVVLIKYIRPTNNRELQNIDQQIVDMMDNDFSSLGWTMWDKSIHMADGQMDRMRRAAISRKMKVVFADRNVDRYSIRGESGRDYSVSEKGCTCPDFQYRGLPCKHMYFVAMQVSN